MYVCMYLHQLHVQNHIMLLQFHNSIGSILGAVSWTVGPPIPTYNKFFPSILQSSQQRELVAMPNREDSGLQIGMLMLMIEVSAQRD